MKKHLAGILIGVLSFISGQALRSTLALPWGETKARIDLARGKYFILAYCELGKRQDDYNKILNKYGIEMVSVGGCDVPKEIQDEVLGYNYISTHAIADRYGKDFFSNLSKEIN